MTAYRLGDKIPSLPDEGEYWIAPDGGRSSETSFFQKNASIWYGSVLRGDNDPITIGENTNIQDNSVLHTDVGAPLTLGANVTVGHRVTLHGCRIGAGSLIGMGSDDHEQCRAGPELPLSARATLITEGKVFPANSMILGAPAKLVRELTPEEVAGLPFSAAH